MRRGSFVLPPSVANATLRFKMEADPMRGYIEERVKSEHPTNAPHVSRTEFYMAYTTWATVNGFHQMSAQRFYESFMAAVVDTVKYPVRDVTVHGVRGYKGIVLK